MTPFEARERCGTWGPETDLPPHDRFEAAVRRRERLEAQFPGFTLEQIHAGLTVPACDPA